MKTTINTTQHNIHYSDEEEFKKKTKHRFTENKLEHIKHKWYTYFFDLIQNLEWNQTKQNKKKKHKHWLIDETKWSFDWDQR